MLDRAANIWAAVRSPRRGGFELRRAADQFARRLVQRALDDVHGPVGDPLDVVSHPHQVSGPLGAVRVALHQLHQIGLHRCVQVFYNVLV